MPRQRTSGVQAHHVMSLAPEVMPVMGIGTKTLNYGVHEASGLHDCEYETGYRTLTLDLGPVIKAEQGRPHTQAAR